MEDEDEEDEEDRLDVVGFDDSRRYSPGTLIDQLMWFYVHCLTDCLVKYISNKEKKIFIFRFQKSQQPQSQDLATFHPSDHVLDLSAAVSTVRRHVPDGST